MPVPDVTSPSVGVYGQPWNASPSGRSYTSNGAQPPGGTPQRQPSYRPPGASAPRIPGHAAGLDSRDDSSSASPSADHHSSVNNPSNSNSYFSPDTNYSSALFNVSNIPPPPPLNPLSHAQPSSRLKTHDHESSDDILAPGALGRLKSQEAREDATNSYGDDDYYDEDDDYYSDEESLDSFVNLSLLSNIAVWMRDQVPRGTHVKGSIPYPRAFTGKDIVSTLQSRIASELLINQGVTTNNRAIALQVARSLQQQLFFYEVEWGGRVLQDGVEDVYMFLDDQEGSATDAPRDREELPTSVITVLTRCYSPSCSEAQPCYSFACPRLSRADPIVVDETPSPVPVSLDEDWAAHVDPAVLAALPESEINRQTVIHKLITKEVQYIKDLDVIESVFIRPLRNASPPVIPYTDLDGFIEDVFGNFYDVRRANRQLLEVLNVRQREQSLVIQRVGDIFLEIATEFRLVYPVYVGHLPLAEKRLKEETEGNHEFRLFLENANRNPDARRMELKVFLNRPSEHLQRYENVLEAIANETAEGNPDADFLMEAVQSFKGLQAACVLQTFQHAMCRGPTGKFEWHNLVSEDTRAGISKSEQKRQSIIFELIKGEMQYVRDLENIDVMYVQPLRTGEPPVIPRDRLSAFITDVYHNFGALHAQHRKLLDRLHAIQRDEHPIINSVTAAIFDAALNWRDEYMEYITNYPIAEYRIVDEMANNSTFKEFVEQCTRHPDANRLDMKNFVNRPIPRLARYELLLKGIMEASHDGHEDHESIPQVIEVIKSLLKETQPGVASAEQKVELWRYNANLVFKPGEAVDMDLLAENRSLIHAGKLLRQPDTGFEWSGWSELFVLLFDNYLVMTKPKEKDGITKYNVNRRPIPLDLLTLSNFIDPPTQRGTGLLRGFGGNKGGGDAQANTPGVTPDTATDSRVVYPCTILHTGRLGGLYTVYAESSQARSEWKEKLEEAIGLRKVVQESNRVFEVETLSSDTFVVPSMLSPPTNHSWNAESSFTGKVTCSVPFTTADGRALVAVGCAEGVWIGFRHDSRSMRRVLHLKMVTQCAMLEDFGIFLVLADKSLFAYHIEALVPTSPQSANTTQTPQKLNGSKDVHFFSVGSLGGRTLVIYMKKKGLDSVFRVLEPVVGKINEKAKAPVFLSSRFGLRQPRSEWFRIYRDFFLPSESYDLIFLKARIAILCTKGFEIMDLSDFKSVTIPQRDDPRHEKLAKRCESCRPMGMFRSSENEFLLCYDEFGLYVNRHGDPSRTKGTIEWEGTAEHVAWHPPYVLIFDSRFIEVRHIETGRLCQIIPGNDLRCIWDGRGGSAPPIAPGPNGTWEEAPSQEARVHGVMRTDDSAQGRAGPGAGRGVAQHVFELIPTVPLFLPEKLSSPTQHSSFVHPGLNGSP
ncbi:Dbl-like domain-containing protein [Lactarius akahatsu]|uniref:Dbl-like domain-containing protein n=1 Tax=Lactarius akahatsu TaxID=416441 RepID=A0AAD4QHR3_9AGAM|nr:Dbl-like domain-containing protein [Lactarius akahatsu]